MNKQTSRELAYLTTGLIKSIKRDYRKGTGLTLRDLSRKYDLSLAAITHICKSINYEHY